MAYNTPPVVAPSDEWTAANQNTYIRDNMMAGVPDIFTTAGDLAYGTGADAAAVLAAGAARLCLAMNAGATAPEWVVPKGTLNMIGYVGVTPNQTTTSTTLEDITNATVTLALTVTCTIILLALVEGYVDQTTAGFGFKVYGMINGTSDTGVTDKVPGNGSATTLRNETLPYMYIKTGVPAGNRIVKLQAKDAASGTHDYITNVRLLALAFAE